MDHAITGTSPHDFTATVEKARAELQKEGFGVLTEIDMQAKMKEKLGQDMPPYLILGACNPPLAWDAVQAAPTIGVLLPCNLCVYDQDGTTHVAAMDPGAALSLIDDATVARVGLEAQARLRRVVAAICA